ncbi:zinc-binding dehydrogenase [Ornithinimicrobium sediminis]|uniref:zinc-binding dehydrogenase n=1 Tax=Ornithinimicrobium sediminis TaxID=2904603 RepID=UPI001E3D7018|nr:zinc-binding dehydrogenase [Ornithinimicrobium sediminis]MCE0485470.1 zinc-binding dehydrogenase [Ornithinimicrobium sediminis]
MTRAVVLNEYGDPSVLRVGDIPEVSGLPSQVLVGVCASGLNRLDLFVRQGLTGPGVRSPRELPHVMGAEGAGVVLEVGPQAETDLQVGDRVMIFSGVSCRRCRYCRRGETSRCAQYAILGEDLWGVQRERLWIDPTNLLSVPARMSLVEAAAVPTTYTTAWTMLLTAGHLRVGEKVLVVGASGGVSVAAIQIAAEAGAEVWATTRGTAKRDRIAALPGVRGVLDSSERGWHEDLLDVTEGTGVDVIVESVGAPTWRDSIQSLSPGGRMMLCGATGGDEPNISIREIYQSHRQIIGAPLGGWNDFVDVVAMLDRCALRPLLHAVMPMEQIVEAHRILEESAHVGKVVVTIDQGDLAAV